MIGQKQQAMSALIRLGWSPPPPRSEVSLRIVDDIARIGADNRYAESLNLSPIQFQILCLIADGLTKEEIAEFRGCSPETIKDQTKRLYAKLGAKNAPNAVAIAYQDGLLVPEPLEAA